MNIIPFRGYFVAPLTLGEFNSLQEVQLMVDPSAAGLAADPASPEKSRQETYAPLGRRLISMGGIPAAGVSLLIGARVESIATVILWLSFGAGAMYFALASKVTAS
jgi:hypothetical protein